MVCPKVALPQGALHTADVAHLQWFTKFNSQKKWGRKALEKLGFFIRLRKKLWPKLGFGIIREMRLELFILHGSKTYYQECSRELRGVMSY